MLSIGGSVCRGFLDHDVLPCSRENKEHYGLCSTMTPTKCAIASPTKYETIRNFDVLPFGSVVSPHFVSFVEAGRKEFGTIDVHGFEPFGAETLWGIESPLTSFFPKCCLHHFQD